MTAPTPPLDITLTTGDTADDIVANINAATTAAGSDIVASNNGGTIELTSNSGAAITVAEGTTTGGAAVLGFGADVLAAKSVDTLVSEVNANTSLDGKIRASNDSGKLRLENQSTQDLTVTGATTAGAIDGLAGTSTIGGNTVRADLSDAVSTSCAISSTSSPMTPRSTASTCCAATI